uniref:Pleckstrin homology and RhoGEF domain containing G4B n=1 Tax=Ursus maritimus TaxID=29073 RepID=A0A452VCI0_URSMA
MEALRNPMPLGSSSEESLGEEACSSQTTGARAAASPTEKEMPSSWGDPVESPHQEKRPGATRSTLPRRSRSWDRSLRSWRGDTRRASQHSVSSRLGGLLGGQAEGTRSAGPSCPPCTPAESPGNWTQEKPVATSVSTVEHPSGALPQQGHDPGRISDVLVEPLCPERGGQPPSTGDVPNQAPRQVLEVSQELLHSGVITLPGTRDHQGRAVVQVCARGPLWSSKHTSSFELTRLLQYFHSIPRKEVQELGLVILVDAREGPAAPALFQALTALQNASPSIIHSIVMLVNKESGFRPDKDGTIQCEVVGSLKALHKLVDSSQLTADLDGSFPYSHSDWISFRRLEPFTTNCKDAIVFLQNSVHSLNTPRTLSTAQEVTDLIGKHKATMKFVLEDALLVALRLEGGTMLARLRREQLGTSQDCRDAIEVASRLYDQVDEEVHRLVLASNRCLQELEGLREVRTLQEGQGHPSCQKRLQLIEENSSQGTEEAIWDFGRHLSTRPARLREGGSAGRMGPPHLGPEPVTEYLKSCHQEATELTAQSFPGASTVAAGLGSQRALRQWHALGLQSPQTRLCFQEALSEVSPDPGSPPLDQRPLKHELARGAERRHCEPSWMPPTDPEGNAGEQAHLLPGLPGQASLCRQEGEHLAPGVPSPHDSPTYSSEPNQTPTTHPRKHPLKKIMRKTRSFEIAQLDSGPRDAHWPGHTGVFIRGLEVTSTMASEKKPPPRPHAESPLVTRNRSLSSPSRTHRSEEDRRRQAGSSRLQHIMAEMLSTEREYVRSLGYVIDNYFPEMERTDLPQDLRGKRSVVFGNLEKLYDFHRQHFLAELERCQHCPLAAGRGFLRHEEQFGMYALYSKNKPQSDALLCSHGNAFFKDKQRELGDKMDLASYLLKPVQRMGKYALLLQDLVREAGCCPAWEQELGELRAAEDVVRFQLRHGNDLLAMDAVRGCDVNLKEQGQLRCQDEFIVCCGRKKSLRHVFLFEDLILFSKTKKVDGGYDTYTYKQSFKTAEIGMTENVGDSGLRFEIWFRRRRKSQDTYILQASSAEVKTAWTHVIGQILWRQALRNREVRMQEMVSMGIGDKPFTDIQPSNAAISDRAVKKGADAAPDRSAFCPLPESWTRAPVVVPPSDHAAPFKRPHSTISDSSTSSSGSQSSALGPLSLQACASPALLSSAYCPWPYDMRTCLEEEDELEQETGRSEAADFSSQTTQGGTVQML